MSLAAEPKDPCEISLWDTHSQSTTTVLDHPKHSPAPSSGDRYNQSRGLTGSCTQFLIDPVHEMCSGPSLTHTFCCVFVHL